MNKKTILRHISMLLFIFLGYNNCIATIWVVDQTGAGNYTSINEAITAASCCDTILINPGIYLENIITEDKPLTIAGQYIITGDESLISQTIIDGNQNGSVFHISDPGMPFYIIGLTIQNGSGTSIGTGQYAGGGIYALRSQIFIQHCIISNNKGGGIFLNEVPLFNIEFSTICNNIAELGTGGITIGYETNGTFKNNTISNNYGLLVGGLSSTETSNIHLEGNSIRFNKASIVGGINPGGSTTWTMDEVNLNSVYGNYGHLSCDFPVSDDNPLFLDTISCESNSTYYIFYFASDTFPRNLVTYNHIYMEEIAANLFVSTEGDNNNDGLTPATAMQNIWYAMYRIKKATRENPRNIFVANGDYPFSLENHFFPIAGKENINLIGEENKKVIIDLNYSPYNSFYMNNSNITSGNLCLKNFNIQNFSPYYNLITFSKLNTLTIDNLQITNGIITPTPLGVCCLACNHINKAILSNITIQYGKTTDYNFTIGADNSFINNIILDNIKIEGNNGWYASSGLALQSCYPNTESFHQVTNLQCTNLESYSFEPGQIASGLNVYGLNTTAVVSNSTFGDNTSNRGAAVTSINGASIYLYNSIIYGNWPLQLSLYMDENSYPPFMEVDYCLVEGGESNICNHNNAGTVNYKSHNIDVNPMWMNTGDHPYSLQPESPCIDAGTEDLPFGVSLPETDILGYYRCFNGVPDIGAYEWVGNTPGFSNNEDKESLKISITPNPFHYSSQITVEMYHPNPLTIEIFSLKGKKVKTLAKINTAKGKYNFVWDGTDKNGNSLPKGIYLIITTINNTKIITNKIEKI